MPGGISGDRKPPISTTPQNTPNTRWASVDPASNLGDGAIQVHAMSGARLVIVDETGAPAVTYIGEAAPGTAVGDAGWRIQRVTVAGSITTIEWAENTAGRYAEFDQVWTARAGLTYG